jgi:hypothetical protein
MNNSTPQTVEEMIVAIAATRTGAIPKTMYSIYANDPRMPVFSEKPDYFIEVNFD